MTARHARRGRYQPRHARKASPLVRALNLTALVIGTWGFLLLLAFLLLEAVS